jgi:hypothetical protein
MLGVAEPLDVSFSTKHMRLSAGGFIYTSLHLHANS